MCGRFVARTTPAQLAEMTAAIDETTTPSGLDPANYPNYNVAPTTSIAAVVCRHAEPGDEPSRRVRLMRWGFTPPWALAGAHRQPVGKAALLINARAETLTTSGAFRFSAATQRCLVPADGYYEWRATTDSSSARKSPKTPVFLYRETGEPLFMAGLWSAWRPSGTVLTQLSCAIITTDAVGGLAAIHHRMPLIMPEQDWDRWLDPDAPADAALLARPPDVHGIAVREVSRLVNSVGNNGPRLLEAAEPQPVQLSLL
ncbi:MAG: SOS response-associated peptidase [Mycobacteriaceae bacterium]|nr:SOS response-associated peptidase [Mycobacteriaceae bacterium]